MSQMSALHHDQIPPTRDDNGQWHDRVKDAALTGWTRTNLTLSYDTAYRLADVILRHAMPDHAPEG